MSRSTWKYLPFKNFEIINYIRFIIQKKKKTLRDRFRYERFTTLTQLNYFHPFFIHQGKIFIKKAFTTLHSSFKVGQFVKTKKPCFYRSRKKKC